MPGLSVPVPEGMELVPESLFVFDEQLQARGTASVNGGVITWRDSVELKPKEKIIMIFNATLISWMAEKNYKVTCSASATAEGKPEVNAAGSKTADVGRPDLQSVFSPKKLYVYGEKGDDSKENEIVLRIDNIGKGYSRKFKVKLIVDEKYPGNVKILNVVDKAHSLTNVESIERINDKQYVLEIKPLIYQNQKEEEMPDLLVTLETTAWTENVQLGPAARFAPEKAVSRVEFITLLLRALGIAESRSAKATFADATSDRWYFGAVETAYREKLVSGVGDGRFEPERQITRQEMAALLVRALARSGRAAALTPVQVEESLTAFADRQNIAPWARETLAAAVRSGLLAGRTKDTLAPEANTSRAEATVVIKHLLDNPGCGG